MRCGAPNNPRVRELARVLRVEINSAIGIIECVGDYADQYCRRGSIVRYGEQVIADSIRCKSISGRRLVAALRKTGWIRTVDGIERFISAEYGRRVLRAERMNMARAHVGPGKRKRVLDRDGRKCRTCGTSDDLTVDHIVSVALGGGADMSNLQSLCRTCNSRKGAR